MVIGISGKYCAGKSTVAELLEKEWGYRQIDVDRLGHEALERRQDEAVARFGEDVLTDGSVDRRKLGAIVFSDSTALADLEAIVHPEMIAMVRARIEEMSREKVAVNAAILFRMGLDRVCDLVIWVEAPLLQRFRRAMERDNLAPLQILKRLYTQRRMKPQSSSRNVDIQSVRNSGNLKDLKRRLDAILPE